MSLALITGCLWVLVATVLALFPMKYQYVPGVGLLFCAPFIIVWIGFVHGWLLCVVGLFALVSMFRRPLRYFYRRARGQLGEVAE